MKYHENEVINQGRAFMLKIENQSNAINSLLDQNNKVTVSSPKKEQDMEAYMEEHLDKLTER